MCMCVSEYTRHLPYYYVQTRTILDRAFINVPRAIHRVQLFIIYKFSIL